MRLFDRLLVDIYITRSMVVSEFDTVVVDYNIYVGVVERVYLYMYIQANLLSLNNQQWWLDSLNSWYIDYTTYS